MERIVEHITTLPEQPVHYTDDGAALSRSLVEDLPEQGEEFGERFGAALGPAQAKSREEALAGLSRVIQQDHRDLILTLLHDMAHADGLDPAAWRADLKDVARQLTAACRRVDPQTTETELETLTAADGDDFGLGLFDE